MYLQRVSIGNFRTFSADFALDLTAGPGVTLVVGQNGLGKSTFCEAMEWCLTGDVKRLSDLPTEGSRKADFLARRMSDGEVAAKYHVAMEFAGAPGATFVRSRHKVGTTFIPSDDPAESELISALKAEAWREPILSLGAHLRLTHFLSQSGEQRFAAQDSKERWSALEAPAGTERLNRIRERLGNKGVTAAFNRQLKDADEAVAKAEADLVSWNEVVLRRNIARRAAEGGGALSTAELFTLLEGLRSEVSGVFGSIRLDDLSNTDKCLLELLNKIERARHELVGKREDVRALEPVAAQWPLALVELAKCESNLSGLQARLSDCDMKIGRLATELEAARVLSRQSADQREEVLSRRATLSAAIEASTELVALRASSHEVMSRLRLVTESELSSARAGAYSAKQRVEDRRRLERSIADATKGVQAAQELAALLSQSTLADSEVKRLAEIHQQRAQEALVLEREQAAIDAERRRLSDELQESESQVRRSRVQVSTIEASVAALASVISDDDKQCPVCMTQFERGALRSLIATSLSSGNDELARAESAVSHVRNEIELLERRARSLMTRKAAELRAAAELAAAANHSTSLRLTIQHHPLLANTDKTSSVESRINSLASDATATLQRLSREAEESPPAMLLEKELTDVEVKRRQVDAKAGQLQNELDVVRAAIVQKELFLSASNVADGVAEYSREVAELTAKEASIQASLEAANRKIVEIEKQLGLVLEQRDRMRSEVAAMGRRMEVLQQNLLYLREAWKKMGAGGDPAIEAVQAQRDLLAFQRRRLAEFESRHRSLSDSRKAWLQAAELSDLENQLATQFGELRGISEDAVPVLLEGRIAKARAARAKVDEARGFRDRLVTTLGEQARHFASHILAPLNSLNENFLRVFSCFSNLSVAMDAKTQQASVKLQFLLRWLAGSADLGTSASIRHFLSEGQLAALSVSLLLSMSTAYRWSRWRSLIMDDPLQHNDVIHAASFIEVIRNLVRHEGYQVVLSTHDLELADYIRRKMAAARVDCRTCQFLGARHSGVTFRSF